MEGGLSPSSPICCRRLNGETAGFHTGTMRVQVPPAAPMGGNAVRAASLSSFRADTTTDTASTGSLRPPIPVDGTDLARPYQRSWA